jgi:hypothetical protein
MKYVNGDEIRFHLDEKTSDANFAVIAGSEEILSELHLLMK